MDVRRIIQETIADAISRPLGAPDPFLMLLGLENAYGKIGAAEMSDGRLIVTFEAAYRLVPLTIRFEETGCAETPE